MWDKGYHSVLHKRDDLSGGLEGEILLEKVQYIFVTVLS